MSTWNTPPIIKIYEALGAIADGRLEISGHTAKCYSSSGNKFYDVSFDPETNAIMTNDNGSYWQSYLGYPAIAFLLQTGELEYKENLAKLLQGVAWKDINQKYKNNFEKTITEILGPLDESERNELQNYANELLEEIHKRQFKLLGEKVKPPSGY